MIPERTPFEGYKSGPISLTYDSDLTPPEAHHLLDKTIVGLAGREYGLVLVLSDGSELHIRGRTYEECALGVELHTEGIPREKP